MKKIILTIITTMLLFFTASQTLAAEELLLTNNEGEISVSSDTVLVGKATKNTSIIDLFSDLSIDGTELDTNGTYSEILDVRYVTPDNQDFKIEGDTDIIDVDSTVYVLFKTTEDGGLITSENNVRFTTKNLKLEEIGVASDSADNAYNVIYEVNNVEEVLEEPEIDIQNEVEEEVTPEIEEIEEEVVVNNEVLEDNNTGIKESIFGIMLVFFVLCSLFIIPHYKK